MKNLKDFEIRIEELSSLEEGWFDGYGSSIEPKLLNRVESLLGNMITKPDLPLPSLFPTPDGGIQAEWRLNHCDVILDFCRNGQVLASKENKKGRNAWEHKTFYLNEKRLPNRIERFITNKD